MSGVLSANIEAKQNGILMENWTKALFPRAKFEYKGAIDCIIDGVQCEVKSCKEYTIDSHNSNGVRTGRVVLNYEQYRALYESDGDYILLVHREGNPFLFFRFKARSICLAPWNGEKSISWRSLIFGGLLGNGN